MWAQLIKARLKAGKEEDFQRFREEIKTVMSAGVMRSTTMRDQSDPGVYYTLVVFESEEKARAREHDPRVQAVVAKLPEIFEGMPEFTNLEVVDEATG